MWAWAQTILGHLPTATLRWALALSATTQIMLTYVVIAFVLAGVALWCLLRDDDDGDRGGWVPTGGQSGAQVRPLPNDQIGIDLRPHGGLRRRAATSSSTASAPTIGARVGPADVGVWVGGSA